MISEKKKTAAKNVGILSNRVRRHIDEFAVRGIYSGAQGRVLHFLLVASCEDNVDIFQKDIEEEYGLRPPTASQLLKSMEKKGLITRKPVEYDARLKKIVVTEKAKKYGDKVRKDLFAFDEMLMKDISEENIDVFNHIVEQMIENIS